MTDLAIEALRAHRTSRAKRDDLLFTDRNRQPLNGSLFVLTEFRRALRRADLPRIRFHDLRHTVATLMLERNAHPLVVSRVVGHSRIQTTPDTYSHSTEELQRDAVQQLGDAMALRMALKPLKRAAHKSQKPKKKARSHELSP